MVRTRKKVLLKLISLVFVSSCGIEKNNMQTLGVSMEDVQVESVSVKEVPSIQPAIASIVPSPISTPLPAIIPNEMVDKVFITPNPTSTPTSVPSPTSTPEPKVIVNNNVNVNILITQNNNLFQNIK